MKSIQEMINECKDNIKSIHSVSHNECKIEAYKEVQKELEGSINWYELNPLYDTDKYKKDALIEFHGNYKNENKS